MIEVGKKAPAFRLADETGRTRSLADFAGDWLVLYFYPKDDTPGCTIEACEFTASSKKLGKLGAAVLGCSADDAKSHGKFIAKYELGIPLLSDPTRATMEKYGAWGEKTMYGKKVTGVIRSTVIIDPAGKVAKHWKSVKAKGHAEQVVAALAELQGGTPKQSKPAAGKPAAKTGAARKKKAASARPAAKASASAKKK